MLSFGYDNKNKIEYENLFVNNRNGKAVELSSEGNKIFYEALYHLVDNNCEFSVTLNSISSWFRSYDISSIIKLKNNGEKFEALIKVVFEDFVNFIIESANILKEKSPNCIFKDIIPNTKFEYPETIEDYVCDYDDPDEDYERS